MSVSGPVMQTALECERHLMEMEGLFLARCKLTLIMRDPENNNADLLLTTDDLDEVAKLVERSKGREEITP